jgi:hypothetical protein
MNQDKKVIFKKWKKLVDEHRFVETEAIEYPIDFCRRKNINPISFDKAYKYICACHFNIKKTMPDLKDPENDPFEDISKDLQS